jgi:predicted nucleic acid-binding protein
MIHLDTNYLIGLLVRGSVPAADVDKWLTACESMATSAVAWSEFLNGPVAPVEINRVEAVIQSRIIPFGQPEAVLASDLFNRTGRRRGSRFDCLIAATAILANAGVANGQPIGFQSVPPSRIEIGLVAFRRFSPVNHPSPRRKTRRADGVLDHSVFLLWSGPAPFRRLRPVASERCG